MNILTISESNNWEGWAGTWNLEGPLLGAELQCRRQLERATEGEICSYLIEYEQQLTREHTVSPKIATSTISTLVQIPTRSLKIRTLTTKPSCNYPTKNLDGVMTESRTVYLTDFQDFRLVSSIADNGPVCPIRLVARCLAWLLP